MAIGTDNRLPLLGNFRANPVPKINMCSIKKLKPVIGKPTNPCCLSGKHFLPVIYRGSKKVWITNELYAY